MKKVWKHELIEIVIPANSPSTKFQIPDQPNLRNVNLVGLESYTIENMPNSILSGHILPTEAQLKTIFLTLQDYKGNEYFKQAPIGILRTLQSGTNGNIDRDFKNFTGQLTNWPKSYIQLSAVLGNVADVSIVFSVYYFDKSEQSNTTFGKKS